MLPAAPQLALETPSAPGRSDKLDRAITPTAPEEAELDAIMTRIRAELTARRQVVASGALAMDALPGSWAEFAALPEDAFLEAAHRVTLGRPAKPEELERGGWELRGGTSRAVLLSRLTALPEAKLRRIPGLAAQRRRDQLKRALEDSALRNRLRPVLRIARGLKRLVLAAPRLARLDEVLAATRQAAVAEQTQRFTSFALQQSEAGRALEARLAALDGGTPSPTLARALAETAAELALPPPAALALLRGAPGPTLAPGTSEEVRTMLATAGLTLAEGEALAGALLVPADASLARLDALLAEAAARLAPDGIALLPEGRAPVAAPAPATPAGAAPPALLRRLAALHGLAYEERDGLRLARRLP